MNKHQTHKTRQANQAHATHRIHLEAIPWRDVKFDISEKDVGKIYLGNDGVLYVVTDIEIEGVVWAKMIGINDEKSSNYIFNSTRPTVNGYLWKEITPNEYPQYFV
jgi:hypothetical protein